MSMFKPGRYNIGEYNLSPRLKKSWKNEGNTRHAITTTTLKTVKHPFVNMAAFLTDEKRGLQVTRHRGFTAHPELNSRSFEPIKCKEHGFGTTIRYTGLEQCTPWAPPPATTLFRQSSSSFRTAKVACCAGVVYPNGLRWNAFSKMLLLVF